MDQDNKKIQAENAENPDRASSSATITVSEQKSYSLKGFDQNQAVMEILSLSPEEKPQTETEEPKEEPKKKFGKRSARRAAQSEAPVNQSPVFATQQRPELKRSSNRSENLTIETADTAEEQLKSFVITNSAQVSGSQAAQSVPKPEKIYDQQLSKARDAYAISFDDQTAEQTGQSAEALKADKSAQVVPSKTRTAKKETVSSTEKEPAFAKGQKTVSVKTESQQNLADTASSSSFSDAESSSSAKTTETEASRKNAGKKRSRKQKKNAAEQVNKENQSVQLKRSKKTDQIADESSASTTENPKNELASEEILFEEFKEPEEKGKKEYVLNDQEQIDPKSVLVDDYDYDLYEDKKHFMLSDFKSIQDYLAKQSRQGYHYVKHEGKHFYFHHGFPKNYYYQELYFENEPANAQWDLWKEDGWELISRSPARKKNEAGWFMVRNEQKPGQFKKEIVNDEEKYRFFRSYSNSCRSTMFLLFICMVICAVMGFLQFYFKGFLWAIAFCAILFVIALWVFLIYAKMLRKSNREVRLLKANLRLAHSDPIDPDKTDKDLDEDWEAAQKKS